MNYRHIYHAGNVCDVVKHAAFAFVVERLRRKETPFCVLDTHAGCGLYDLHDPRAAKTAESETGVSRLLKALAADGWEGIPEGIRPYLDVLKRMNPEWSVTDPALEGFRLYPGSPALAANLMRPQDRLVACELHAEDSEALRRNMRGWARAHLHRRDGYEALGALLPPPEKRGLVLIDPPYEDAQEFEKIPDYLAESFKRWPHGLFMLWYPIKERPAVWRFHEALRARGLAGTKPDGGTENSRLLCAEFVYREEIRADTLNGSGLIVANPPWRLDEALREIFSFLHKALGTSYRGIHVERL